jgi:hypothetical protein
MNFRSAIRSNLIAPLFLAAIIVAMLAPAANAQVLVGDPFITSYQNWVDPAPARGGNWRLSLHNLTLMETSDLIPTGNNPAAATNNGSFVPSLVVQDAFTTPATYNLNARLLSNDDDGFGLVFGYQDIDNYFRVTLRAQANGNLGGTTGLSVQKVVGGVVTQINPAGVGPGVAVDPTFALIDSRSPHDVTVAVDGANYSVSIAGLNNGQPLVTGSDAALMPGKIGVHSWAQRNRTGNHPHWGTEVESISVSNNTGTLYSGTFNSPIQWRPLHMANSNGVRTNDPPSTPAVIVGDDRGNFGLDINNPWIYQQTNGFEWATETLANIDFLGPAVVVDEPGSENWSDYAMRVRLGSADDDGLGVLVRVQDDNNFYRVTFTSQPLGAPQLPHERAPFGLSVQKVRNGVWTELFRDNQDDPLFEYDDSGANTDTPATGLPMFDLVVRAVGNQLAIQVIDGDDVINYPLITDANDPLLRGTVGLHAWGSEHDYYMAFGGQPGGPLLTFIPEPASAMLLALGCVMLGVWRRQRNSRTLVR